MTRERMLQLKRLLESSGWKISAQYENVDIFYVEYEKIIWNLFHGDTDKSLQLSFYLYDDFGRYTEKLNDIGHVMERSSGKTLYFSKINSKRWKPELEEFVRNLSLPESPHDLCTTARTS